MNIRIRMPSCAMLAVVVTVIGLIFLAPMSVARAQTDDQAGDTETPADDQDPAEPISFREPTTPRALLSIFVRSLENDQFARASALLDYSELPEPPSHFQQARHARRLNAVIDGLPIVNPETIKNDPEGDVYGFPPNVDDAPIELKRMEDGRWLFSPTTVANIDKLYALYGKEVVPKPESAPPTTKPADEVKPAEAKVEPKVEVPAEVRSARRTLRTLMNSLDAGEFQTSIETLDFSKTPEKGPYAQLRDAQHLRAIIDRMAAIDYAQISDDPDGPSFRFPPDSVSQPIVIEKLESGHWNFSAETVDRIDEMYERFRDRPVLNVAEQDREWYNRELFLGNETWRVMFLFGAIFTSLAIGHVLRSALRWREARLRAKNRELSAISLMTLSKTVVPITFLIGLNVGIRVLVLEHQIDTFVSAMIRVIFTLVIGYILFRLVDVAVELLRQLALRTGSTLNDMLVPIVGTSLRLTIIVLVVLEVMTALSDKPPSSVIAGLGVSGLALGLAAQDTLKNFFGSVMIFADRPFELGDRIVVDGHDGPVESVGFRSTRIRTLDGHLVTVPNGEVAHKTIHNIGKRPYIRRVMNVRIAYDTPPEKLQRSLEIIEAALQDHEGMKPDLPPRVFLEDFHESALNVRAIYWYHPPNYWDYCAFGERLNLELIRQFDAEGIRFGLPSQTLYLDDRRKT